MNSTYDLVVAGGGPAGTSAAITAARLGFKVLLLEAGSFPRHKVCGEFISAEGVAVLEQLLADKSILASAARIGKARILLDKKVAEIPLLPPAISLSRYVMDEALWHSTIAAGAETRLRTSVYQISRCDEIFSVTDNDSVFRARTVIDASGRWSKLRSRREPLNQKLIGLKGHFYDHASSESCDLYFFAGGYCGVQPLGNGRINAAAIVDSSIARNLEEVFDQHPILAQRAQTWKTASEPASTAPLFFGEPQTMRGEVALAGDAAAFIDPFAGDGISLALHSGQMAALELSKYLSGSCPLAAALHEYDRKYRDLILPALASAGRMRQLLRLPKALQAGAVSLLKVSAFARAIVEGTRIRHAS